MTESELEHTLRDWARADADVSEPAQLRELIMALPEGAEVRTRFGLPSLAGWHRSRPFRAAGIAAAVLLLFAGVLVPGILLGPEEDGATGEAAATVLVAQDGSGDHETITDAVGASADGDTILVRPGTYVESVLIDKDITLRGDGDRGEIVIRSPSELPDRWLPRDEQPYAVRLDDSEATVENVTFTGPASSLIVRGGSPRITNVAVIDVGDANRIKRGDETRFAGLALDAGSRAQVHDSLFRRSDVVVGDGAEVAFEDNELDASMIQLGGTWGAGAPTDSLVRGNTSHDAWIAIWVEEGATARILDNEISGAESAGALILYGGPDTVIRGNSIRDSRTAIMVVNGPVDVIENDLSGNELGLNISGAGASIRDNHIRGNTVGVLISSLRDEMTSLTLDRNTIEGNVRGIAIKAGVSAAMTGNVVCDNGTNLDIVDGADVTLEDDRICTEEPTAAAR
jgi:hypothetical protein